MDSILGWFFPRATTYIRSYHEDQPIMEGINIRLDAQSEDADKEKLETILKMSLSAVQQSIQ